MMEKWKQRQNQKRWESQQKRQHLWADDKIRFIAMMSESEFNKTVKKPLEKAGLYKQFSENYEVVFREEILGQLQYGVKTTPEDKKAFEQLRSGQKTPENNTYEMGNSRGSWFGDVNKDDLVASIVQDRLKTDRDKREFYGVRVMAKPGRNSGPIPNTVAEAADIPQMMFEDGVISEPAMYEKPIPHLAPKDRLYNENPDLKKDVRQRIQGFIPGSRKSGEKKPVDLSKKVSETQQLEAQRRQKTQPEKEKQGPSLDM